MRQTLCFYVEEFRYRPLNTKGREILDKMVAHEANHRSLQLWLLVTYALWRKYIELVR